MLVAIVAPSLAVVLPLARFKEYIRGRLSLELFSCVVALMSAGSGRNDRGNNFKFISFNWISFNVNINKELKLMGVLETPFWNDARLRVLPSKLTSTLTTKILRNYLRNVASARSCRYPQRQKNKVWPNLISIGVNAFLTVAAEIVGYERAEALH